MKKITRLFSTLMFSLFALCLVACGGPSTAEEALKLLIVDQSSYVDADFKLAGTIMYNGVEYDLTWKSNNEALVISELKVVDNTKYYVAQPDRSKAAADGSKIIVTASLTIDEKTATKDFNFIVYPIDVFEVADAFKFDKANKVVTEEFELETSFEYSGITASIEWSVPAAYEGLFTIANNKVSFNVEDEVEVKISATFTADGVSTKKDYVMTLKQSTDNKPTIVDPIDGKAFVFGLYQESIGKYLYFAGKAKDGQAWYMQTTENAKESTKVTAEAVEGGYHLSFIDAEGNKKYLDIDTSGKASLYIKDAPSCVYTYNEEHQTFISAQGGKEYYIGTYNSYETLSASETKYISTSYPAHFYQMPLSVVTTPEVGKTYTFGLKQESIGKLLYFAGKAKDGQAWYMQTTENAAASTQVTVEAADGGFYLSFIDATGAKKYLDIDTSGKASLYIKDAPSCVFTWDAEYNTFVSVGTDGVTYYMGTYNSYETLSASKYSYISTSYPCHLYE